ncbi:hypothetical protein [Candidatus Neptunochlamydia vexilliferae]|uniref:Uncharacterized protein n=1 Tax=Candidatus Neptunichlamydia vexilliferae TaxID=1651774 RepID=A0ABS0AWI7_9BACT|nr:hypothetical protein [Candidatus Neptunochlamydia vexilliferae]MBF5058516.1 hypothetical protein [Candidatus Neptunochlamydia vexilliferae]
MNKNIEVTEKKTEVPSAVQWAVSPAGALSSTLLDTATTALEGADLYYELQRMNQQEGIKVNRHGFKARKEQGENQKFATSLEGWGLVGSAGVSLGAFVGGLGAQSLLNKTDSMQNAQAFDQATRGVGVAQAGVTDMPANTLAGSPEVRARIDALVNGVDFENGPSRITVTSHGTTPLTDEEVLQLATPAEREAVNKQARDKMKELGMANQQYMQVWNQMVPVVASVVTGGTKIKAAEEQYEATLNGATAERFNGLGQQFAAFSSQEGQESQQLLSWLNALYQTIGEIDAANGAR